MNAKPSSTGGYIAFAKLTLDGLSKFLVVMLHPQAGLTIDQNLNLVGVSHLELKHIDKAASLTNPSFGDKALVYAGFRKVMSLYFQEFLGSNEVRNPVRDTKKLIQVIDQYAHDKKLTAPLLPVTPRTRTRRSQGSPAS